VGAWVARWLAKVGAAMTLIARSAEQLHHVAREVERLGGRPLPFAADVAVVENCLQAVELTLHHFCRIDALVNNAAVVEPLAFAASAEATSWRYNIEVNLLAPFYLSRAAIPELRRQQGRIINVSSGAAVTAIQAASAYCAAKAGLNQLTRVLAVEEPGITSIAVRPGVVDTDMQALIRSKGSAAMPAEQVSYYQSLKEQGKLEHPAIPGRSIAWLCLYAPKAWSGTFMDYDDPRVVRQAVELFGEYGGDI